MKNKNNLGNYRFVFMIAWIFYFGTSCNVTKQIKEIEGNYNRNLVYSKCLIEESLREPYLMERKGISHAYASLRDSFVITLIDVDKNESFINSKDVIVVSTIHDSVAPIIPDNSINAAFFRSGLVFDFFGKKYQIFNASSDGKQIDIRQVQLNDANRPQLIVSDQVSDELMVSEINSNNSFNLLETIRSQNKKYVLLDFWSPNCPPCFENIPTLDKFENEGIGIINIFYMDDDEVALVENQISRFKIPGMNFRSSPELIKYFSQNGFPYTVLIDADNNKMLLSSHWINVTAKYLNL